MRSVVCKLIVSFGFTIVLGTLAVVAPTDSVAAGDFETGLQAARAGQLDRAVELWTRFIERNPKSYSAYVNRGNAYMRNGYVFKGIMDWHEARKLSPLFAFGVYSQGYIAQASGDTAMLNYVSPLELDFEYIPSVVMIGIAYLELGQKAKAAELYRKSMDLTKNPLLKTHLDHWADEIESSTKK